MSTSDRVALEPDLRPSKTLRTIAFVLCAGAGLSYLIGQNTPFLLEAAALLFFAGAMFMSASILAVAQPPPGRTLWLTFLAVVGLSAVVVLPTVIPVAPYSRARLFGLVPLIFALVAVPLRRRFG